MVDRFSRKKSGPEIGPCPLCGSRGVLFTGIGFTCAGGCSATAKEITEAGDDMKKLRKFLRKGKQRNAKFERGVKSKKILRKDRFNRLAKK